MDRMTLGNAARYDDPASAPAPETSSAAPLVELEGVCVDFEGRRTSFTRGKSRVVRAVDKVDLSISAGRSLGLVGESGSGKTTVGRVVAGMLSPTRGIVKLNGKAVGQDRNVLASYRRHVQIVFQDPYSSLDPRMRVGSIIAEPLIGRRGPWATRSRRRQRVDELLRLVGLPPDAAGMYPHQFSGGQRQRIALARALSSNPRLIVLDEPTSALDVSIRAQILTLLRDLQRRLGVSYLVISHDLGSVAYLVSRVAVMYRGRIVEEGSPADIYRTPRHPYTRMLLDSVPREDVSFITLEDDAADETPSVDTDQGCSYRHRCDLRERLADPSRCEAARPELLAVGGDHLVACHGRDWKSENMGRTRG
jgi:oligopeptide/dipeptide ABC transporter ATP-binding protein